MFHNIDSIVFPSFESNMLSVQNLVLFLQFLEVLKDRSFFSFWSRYFFVFKGNALISYFFLFADRLLSIWKLVYLLFFMFQLFLQIFDTFSLLIYQGFRHLNTGN